MPKVEWSQQDLLKLIERGKTTLEIVRIQKIGYEVINRRMHKIDETLLEKAMQKGQAKREVTLQKEQEQILRLTKQGKYQTGIAQVMDVKQTDISMRIKEIDKTLVNEAINEAVKQGLRRPSNRRVEIKQEEILERIRQEKSQHKIARAFQVADTTINKKIASIPQKLLEDARQEGEKRRQEEEKNKEKEQKEIAGILGVSNNTISREISKTDEKAVLEPEIEGETKQQGVEGQEETEQTGQRIQEKSIKKESRETQRKTNINAKTIRKKMDAKEITVNDVNAYRMVIDEKYDKVTLEEIILLVNAYIKTKQTTEAIRFLNMTMNNEDLAYLGVEKLEKAKMQLERMQKQQMARRLLKDDMRTSYIMAQTGLKETEILALKRDMEKRLGTQL